MTVELSQVSTATTTSSKQNQWGCTNPSVIITSFSVKILCIQAFLSGQKRRQTCQQMS